MKTINTNRIILLTFLFISIPSLLYSQQKSYPKKFFRAPVDFQMTLSGNFGELRNNHFHSGIDIRTFTVGKSVYAVADGFVSRIKISAGGYGKAIYIDHPNGYTTVYAHLSNFNKKINKFIKSLQYNKKSFEIDINLTKGKFPVRKGEIIAISGNTGASAGPHLHFEIRDTKSEHPINPMLFGFKIKDSTAPKIFNLYVYPLDSVSSINGENSRQKFPVTYYNNSYHLKGDPKIVLAGKIGFAIQTNDYLDNTWGKCGIYQLQFKVNDTLQTKYTFNEFSFDESRYSNSLMDYSLNILEHRKVYKCFKDINNQLSVYEKNKNDGKFTFLPNNKYKIDIISSDTKFNKARLRIYATGGKQNTTFTQDSCSKLMLYSKANSFKTDDIELLFPDNSFYTDIKFKYSIKKDSNFLSNIYSIHESTTPVHTYYTLAIKTNRFPIDENKVFIASIGKDGKLGNVGGVYINGWVKSKARTFGDFAIAIDTIAPKIKARTNFKLKSLSGKKGISFKIADQESGIKSYLGTIDGKWVLFEFDQKNDLLRYTFDKNRLIPNKKHTLQLQLTDKVGNKIRFKTNFYW